MSSEAPPPTLRTRTSRMVSRSARSAAATSAAPPRSRSSTGDSLRSEPSGRVRTSTTSASAIGSFVMHFFLPLRSRSLHPRRLPLVLLRVRPNLRSVQLLQSRRLIRRRWPDLETLVFVLPFQATKSQVERYWFVQCRRGLGPSSATEGALRRRLRNSSGDLNRSSSLLRCSFDPRLRFRAEIASACSERRRATYPLRETSENRRSVGAQLSDASCQQFNSVVGLV